MSKSSQCCAGASPCSAGGSAANVMLNASGREARDPAADSSAPTGELLARQHVVREPPHQGQAETAFVGLHGQRLGASKPARGNSLQREGAGELDRKTTRARNDAALHDAAAPGHAAALELGRDDTRHLANRRCPALAATRASASALPYPAPLQRYSMALQHPPTADSRSSCGGAPVFDPLVNLAEVDIRTVRRKLRDGPSSIREHQPVTRLPNTSSSAPRSSPHAVLPLRASQACCEWEWSRATRV
jgi:hypothetical protein